MLYSNYSSIRLLLLFDLALLLLCTVDYGLDVYINWTINQVSQNVQQQHWTKYDVHKDINGQDVRPSVRPSAKKKTKIVCLFGRKKSITEIWQTNVFPIFFGWTRKAVVRKHSRIRFTRTHGQIFRPKSFQTSRAIHFNLIVSMLSKHFTEN